MTIIDWIIFIIPIVAVMGVGIYCRKYIKSVVDFLAAGRVAGRFVLSISSVTDGAMGLIILVGYVEVAYKTGFAINFWNHLRVPLAIMLALVGFVTYRYREMKVLSFGQFIEMRYSKTLRIFAAILRSTAEIMASMLAPALAARFFMYMFGWPPQFDFFGITFDTYIVIVIVVISMAMTLILYGGILGLMVTDCIMGLILFPCIAIMTLFIVSKFSWFSEMAPVLMDRVPGESFINPYSVEKLQDFNLFNFLVFTFGMVFHYASWMGGGSSSAARSPHEQKMAGLLGRWGQSLFWMFCMLLGIMLLTYFNHIDFSKDAKVLRDTISNNVIQEIVPDKSMRANFAKAIAAVPEQKHVIGVDEPLSHKKNLDTPHLQAVENMVKEKGLPMSKMQEFTTFYHQLMLPVTLRQILPIGLFGLFALMMFLMMISTDDTRIYCSGATIAQDIILPLLKKAPTPQQHLWLLKGCMLFVGLMFFLGSTLMKQMDYINLFITIVSSIWMGGCAPVMLGGLYCKYGNTTGAYCSLVSGMSITLGGMFAQRNWADMIYPWLERHGLVETAGNILTALSSPFNPIIVWEMNPKKFPVNSVEIYAIAMLVSLIFYMLGSMLTYKGAFNMDKMLHRGIYNEDNDEKPKTVWKLSTIFSNFVGIGPEYSKWDKLLAWFSFYHQIVYAFLIGFVLVALWNGVVPWSNSAWSIYFLIFSLIMPGIIAVIFTPIYTIGGWKDIFRLFKDLKNRKTDNENDNGMVIK